MEQEHGRTSRRRDDAFELPALVIAQVDGCSALGRDIEHTVKPENPAIPLCCSPGSRGTGNGPAYHATQLSDC